MTWLTMESADEDRWADPDTLLGLLQRGRGEGYRRSLSQRDDAGELVVDCIIRDPRWDRQVEERGWFYAALVAELNIDLSLLRPAYSEPPAPNSFGWDADAWLATEVFELAARRGDPAGVTELRRYLRSGRDVGLALHHLLPLATCPAAFGLLEDILEVADTGELCGALSWTEDFRRAPWPAWRRASSEVDYAVRAVLSERASRPKPAPLAEAEKQWAVERHSLLVRAGREAQPGSPLARLAELGDDRGEHTLLEIAPTLLGDPAIKREVKIAARLALRRLRSAESLAWARATASLDHEGGLLAVGVVAERAEEADLRRLRALLDAAVAGGNNYMNAQVDLVDGIGRLGDQVSLGVIQTLFDETVYSYLRGCCARALSVIDGGFATTRAVECLQDCASQTRSTAITAVDTSRPGVPERLSQIAEDPTEDEDVCRQAEARLGEMRHGLYW